MSVSGLLDPALVAGDVLLTRLADLLPGPTGGGAVLAAVVVLTGLVRLLLLPLAVRRARVARRLTALAPELEQLRRRHAGDPRELARETARLHRSAGAGVLALLAPTLVQLPVLPVLYRTFSAPVLAGVPGAVVLGAPLSAHWPALVTAAGALSAPAALCAVLLTALAVVAYLTGRQQLPRSPGPEQLAGVLPFLVVGLAATASVAVTVYLLTSTSWTLLERALL